MSQKNLEEIFKKSTLLAKEFLTMNAKAFSPYGAVLSLEKLLKNSQFEELKEGQSWTLTPGKGYYLKRGFNSSLVAFSVPKNFSPENSLFKIIGTHSDSPCVRLAPNFEYEANGYD